MEQVLPTVFRHIVSAETIFLGLEIQRSQYIRPKVTVYKCAETIQGRKLYEETRYIFFMYCEVLFEACKTMHNLAQEALF